jgi:signal transduction histidine kinase
MIGERSTKRLKVKDPQMTETKVEIPSARERQMTLVHELRGALNVLMMGFGLIKQGAIEINPRVTVAMQHALVNMNKLIDRAMLDAKEIAESIVQQERLSTNDLMEELAAYAELVAKEKGHTFVMDNCPAEAFILVDRVIITQAMINLIQNAFKFTRPASYVTLSCSHSPECESVTLSVTDQCYGLAVDDNVSQIKKFEQRHDDKSGLGIGVHITKGGIEAQGGELVITDHGEAGCTFAIKLPRVD